MERGWKSIRRCAWCLPLALLVACGADEPAGGAEPATQPSTAPDARTAGAATTAPAAAGALLDKAIAAAGGLEALERAARWSSRTKGEYMNTPFEARNAYRPGELRMEVTTGGDQPMTMVSGVANCWTASGPVVIPCAPDEQQLNAVNMAVTEALRLAPLKQPGYTVTASRGLLAGAPCDVLEAEHAATGTRVRLLLDPRTSLVAEARYAAELFDRRGEFVIALGDYRERCGARLPDRRTTSFEGRTLVTEQTVELDCTPPDPALFQKPPQVADGSFAERRLPALALACQIHRGALDQIDQAMPRLLFFLDGNGLRPAGPPVLLLHEAPPAVTEPGEFTTDFCVPFEGERPDEIDPGAGGAAVKLLPPTRVLSVFGLGEALARAPELARAVTAEAARRGLTPTGPPRLLSYLATPDQPPEQQVSELQLPIAD